MRNPYHMYCPSWGSDSNIRITANFDIHLTGDGAKLGDNTTWSEKDEAGCDECGWEGIVENLVS